MMAAVGMHRLLIGSSAAAALLVLLNRQIRRPFTGIRAARRSDCATIVAYTKALADESEGFSLTQRHVQRGVSVMVLGSLFGLQPRCWVYEEDGQVFGMIGTCPEWSDWHGKEYWWVLTMYVAPSHRRRGIATKLLTTVKEAALKHGVQTVNLRVERDNIVAQRLYQSVGFAVDESHLVMAFGHTPSGDAIGR